MLAVVVRRCTVPGCRAWANRSGRCPSHDREPARKPERVPYSFTWRKRDELGRFAKQTTGAGVNLEPARDVVSRPSRPALIGGES